MKIRAHTSLVSKVIAVSVLILASWPSNSGIMGQAAKTQTGDVKTDDTIDKATTSLNKLKSAVVDHFAEFGSFPVGDNAFELLLTKEGFLKESLSLLSRNGNPLTKFHVRVIKPLSSTVPVTATNAAYNFKGGLTNQTTGECVVETVVFNVAGRDARELSLRVDGPELSCPLGNADLKGRVKYDAIPTNRFGEVHVYLTHRGS